MKRTIVIILAMLLLVTFSACDSGKKAAFDAAKTAYDSINAAYETTEKMGSDTYEVWRLGIYSKDDILKKGCSYLASELDLSENDLRNGAAYTLLNIVGKSWDTSTEDEKKKLRDNADASFELMKDDLFSYCVHVVKNAYILNGDVEKVQNKLSEAKSIMKEMSDKYSDYEHYPSLKGFFTTTSSFFDFCQNPEGSFEQVKTSLEQYRTNARNYKADLTYVFDD